MNLGEILTKHSESDSLRVPYVIAETGVDHEGSMSIADG